MRSLGIDPSTLPQTFEPQEDDRVRRYLYDYCQTQYATVVVEATSESEADNLAWDKVIQLPVSEWGDGGDIEFSDAGEISPSQFESYPLTEDTP